MSKLIQAEDILADVRGCVDCIFMAAEDLGHGVTAPIQAVALIASNKINDAIALMDEYRNEIGEGPAPDAGPEPTPAMSAAALQAQVKRRAK